jgi:hypothetical protein
VRKSNRPREYLTEREIEKLMDAARAGRYQDPMAKRLRLRLPWLMERRRNPEQPVDIDGAVGTSGGLDCFHARFLAAHRQQGHGFAVAGIGARAQLRECVAEDGRLRSALSRLVGVACAPHPHVVLGAETLDEDLALTSFYLAQKQLAGEARWHLRLA